MKQRLPVALVAVTLTLVATNLWWWLARPAPDAPAPSRQRIQLGSAVQALGSYAHNVALAPDGSAIAFIDTVGGTPQIGLKERGRTDASAVAGTAGAEGNVMFYPAGDWIGFYGHGSLNKVPRAGGSATPLSDSASQFQGAWMEDGTIFFTGPEGGGPEDRGLFRVGEEGGPAERLVGYGDTGHGFGRVTPLPDGRGVLFEAWASLAHQVLAYDAATGQVHLVVAEAVAGWYVPGGQLAYVGIDGGMFIAPFDLATLSISGSGTGIEDGIRTDPDRGDADLQLGAGMLLHVRGQSRFNQTVAWLDRDGRSTVIDPGLVFVAQPQGGRCCRPTTLASPSVLPPRKAVPSGPGTWPKGPSPN